MLRTATKVRTLVLGAATAALLLALGVAGAHAQGAQGAQGAQDPGMGGAAAPEAKSFSDDDLQAFAQAQGKIQEIGSKYQQQIQGASDPAQTQALRQEMNQEMVDAVTGTGLDVGTYNEIASAVRTDPGLAARIEEMR